MNEYLPALPTRVSYAIGLVLYHPEESLLKRVDQMVELGFQIYVFDNSPFDCSYINSIRNHSSIFYLTAGKNVGIGFSLATLCATAYSHGHLRLLFLDQDTCISGHTLEFVENFAQRLPIDTQQQYAALVFSGQKTESQYIQDVRLAISSGSLFNLSLLRQIGWHNEKYFVDCVDYELCIRARRCGLKIGLVQNTPDFDHVTEQPDRSIKIIGKQVLVRRYSISRITDALGAYLKLIVGGVFRNNAADTFALIKSAVIYMASQLIARLIREKE